MAVATCQSVLWADHMQFAKPVLQALPPECKIRGHLVQAEPLTVCNRLGQRPFHIDSTNNVCLFRWKRRQEQVKAVAYQRFKLIIANWIWLARRFHEHIPRTEL